MKILHCADLHLDSKMMTHLTSAQAKTRKMEILHTFTRMVEYAAAHEIQIILIAGDLFDTRNVSATVRNQVYDMITTHPNIDFLYLKGNHDDDNFLSRLEAIPENLKLFKDEWTSYRYGNITINGLELSENNQATYANSLLLDTDTFNIVTLHGQLTGYTVKKDAANISLAALKNHHIDYLALGHVHEYSFGQLDARGYYCYPGCLEGRGFDECDEHGFIVIDINEESLRPSYSFVPIAYRTIYTVPVDVTDVYTTHEASERIEQTIAKGDYSSKSLVRFVLTGNVDVNYDINTHFLEEHFASYFFYEQVVDETTLQLDYQDFEKDASLKGEFIRMVLGSGLDEGRKNKIIRCGIDALMGEEN